MRFRSSIIAAVLLAGVLPSVRPSDCRAQSLRGSRASIRRMYRHARAEKLHFYETARGVRGAVRQGVLVRLVPDSNFALHDVGYPFVRRSTRTFVERLGAQYRDACGERLVVTSATRPATRQPANSTERSVHPTGMAVDLHKPRGDCLHWLRSTLLALENASLLEATEEFSPPHFHVAVFPTPYVRYVARRSRAATLATRTADAGGAYEVRPGDTLWDIARAHDLTVDRLEAANQLAGPRILPGQTLIIPTDSDVVSLAGDSGSSP